MSHSPVVDQRYRMAPADLGGRARQVMVRQVSLEGVEELGPLLYFEGVARPLALDHDQRTQMSRIAHSNLPADWVGAALVLRPVREQGRETIRLLDIEPGRGPQTDLPRAGWNSTAPSAGRALLRVLLVLLGIGVAMAAVLLVDQVPDLTFLTDLFTR